MIGESKELILENLKNGLVLHCRYCRCLLTPENLTFCRKTPVSRGGSKRIHSLTEVVLTCTTCHSHKDNLTDAEFISIPKPKTEYTAKAWKDVKRRLRKRTREVQPL
jgi:5-methylcytosine-specific restriction endonuclease McrA